MKLFATSDLHGHIEGLDPAGCDIAIIAGDFSPLAGFDFASLKKQQRWIKGVFFDWCGSYPAVTFCVVAGNHDLTLEHPDEWPLRWPANVRYLKDSGTEAGGLRIYGTPWVPYIQGRWAFEERLYGQLLDRFGAIPEGTDVLVTHTPPSIPGSRIDISPEVPDCPHFGSVELTAAIERVKPRLVFCGHIHPGDHTPYTFKHRDGSGTVIRNVSRLDDSYHVAFPPAIVDI
jgi:Icc-related predicted phosphoesterase